MVRWNPRSPNANNGEHNQQQQEHDTNSRNSPLERKVATFSDDDDDEQDYSCDHQFDDDIDCNPHDYHNRDTFGEAQSVPPSSNFHEPDDDFAASNPLSFPSTIPNFGMLPPSMTSSSSDPNHGGFGQLEPSISSHHQSAVVIEDPGLDHETPPDECSAVPAPVHVWRPQNQQSTCEFTHTILHYSQKRESGCKKAEYSATTVDTFGNKWRLIVYVNGNGRASNHHLSLFLQVADADELPFGWKKAVSYVLTLEHPSGPTLGYAKRNPDKTFKLCPKAIDWGWSQFITSDRIQQEGYISSDSLTVRASVTVKSSSVSIDTEDAELYLKCAVEEGNAQAVVACLAQGASVNCQFKDDLYTPLHTACSSSINNGSLEVLTLLLERGADGNACNKWRETPLLIAANNGHRKAVELLLDHGADPSLCSEAGWSALTFAAHKGYEDIVSLLLLAGAPVNCRVTEDLSTPLHKACAGGKAGHLSAVKQLLDSGADVHALNKWRETPLLTAANHGQASAVSALLRAGADPCKCTDTGWSPLSIAAYKGHDDVVRLLLEEGAPTEEADPTLSALLQAATKGLPDTVELLLRHGADHTVTTKKGDTALSILVEQNLIDAAVEMVTEYKASVPRCSRDRKKVQRARLLINLRVKQQQREGLVNGNIDSDDDSEQDESDDGSKSALHALEKPSAVAPQTSKKKRKDKIKSRESAEAEAKAAEEALLLELEKEETQALKEEAMASSKRAKKKKKRDNRQQRLKDIKLKLEDNDKKEKEKLEQEQKQKELREKEEKEKLEKEIRERERIEKELRLKAEREREQLRKEEEERERLKRIKSEEQKELAASRRKERNEREKRLTNAEKKGNDKHDRLEKKSSSHQNASSNAKKTRSSSKGKQKRLSNAVAQVEPASDVSEFSVMKATINTSNSVQNDTKLATKARGWETKHPPPPTNNSPPSLHMSKQKSASSIRSPSSQTVSSEADRQPRAFLSNNSDLFVEEQLKDMANGVVDFLGFDTKPNGVHHQDQSLVMSTLNLGPKHQMKLTNGFSSIGQGSLAPYHRNFVNEYTSFNIELPGPAIFQQEKVIELFNRMATDAHYTQRVPLSKVGEKTLRIVIYRYIVRAAHSSSQFLDPVIPSWTDTALLVAFLQRQLISERCRSSSPVMNNNSSSIEMMKEAGTAFADLCIHLAKELSQFREKCTQQINLDWTDTSIGVTATELLRNGSPTVLIDWGGTQVFISQRTFSVVKSRYIGPPNRMLTAIFSMIKRHETERFVIEGTPMDCRFSPSTIATLSTELSVSVEGWSDPISTFGGNLFFSPFPDVDSIFGSLIPFGKENGHGEQYILEHGGSVAMIPPLENATAALYIKKMVDLLEQTESMSTALSFAIFLPSECFRELASIPKVADLQLLDPRLGDKHQSFVCRVESLVGGNHVFFSGQGEGNARIIPSGSLFVLLQNEFGRHHYPVNDQSVDKVIYSLSPHATFFPNTASVAPNNPFLSGESISTISNPFLPADLSNLSGATMGSGLYDQSSSRRRGRLFDLVDDGDDEFPGDGVDVVSGMLSNLNVNIRDNNNQDVDIEAISLMGISGFINGHTGGFQ